MIDFKFFFLDKKQQYFYRILREAISRHENLIPIQGLSVEEINTVLGAVLTDTPDFFWFEGKWSIEKLNDVWYIVPHYTFDSSTSNEIQGLLDEMSISFCKKIADKLNIYDKVRATYDWIISNAQYDMSQRGGQTIYDSLIIRKAVCKGLSKGFQYLLNKVNCFSTLQDGTLNGVSRHVWNIVEIHDRYYNVDVSMGYDCFSYLFEKSERSNRYRCFIVSDAKLEKTHKIYYSPRLSLNCEQEYPGGD